MDKKEKNGIEPNAIERKETERFIQQCEQEFQEKIQAAAQRTVDFDVEFILVSGPSSSGKTTFVNMLSQQLLQLGKRSIRISLDNYFHDRSTLSAQEEKELDFESIEALDITAFFRDMNAIIEGREVQLPIYDFTTGTKRNSGPLVNGAQCDVVMIEGLHALSSVIIETLINFSVMTVFLNPASTIPLPDGTFLSSIDLRFFRRLVRDYRFRASSVENTFQLWENVRRGEILYVFPESENADLEVDTTHLYEVGVLKPEAQSLLLQLPANSPYQKEAGRLLMLLGPFQPIPETLVPKTSLLREFIG